jgi:serine/threonine protein kinase/formylglycine-generating enzyme required for sulfatase activity
VNNSQRYATLSDDQLRAVHAACETFEQALRNGKPICIEDQIAAAPQDIRSPLFCELLAIELELRAAREGPPNAADYQARFPDHIEGIRQVFGEMSEARPADDLPKKIGRYRIQNVLGTGAFGRVYLAYDEELKRPVAIKVPHASLVSRPEDAKRYLTEARMVANLDHPHIVGVQDVGSTDECPCYIVFKYVDGTDLAKRIKQPRLSYMAAAELVATLAEALHYAHKHGLVHRDVKPNNILMDTEGKPYLADFGLALRDQDLGSSSPRFVGTPHYMSPEQARGEGHRVDGRCDIYSLGAVFYELLVGRRTFSGGTQAELLDQITSQEPRPPRQIDDKVPKELERICLKALAKRASERYTTALDMAEDLRHFLETSRTSWGGLPIRPTTTASLAGASRTAADHPRAAGADSKTSMVDSDSQPIKIVPKGLRAFDENDADFFLELLPGPRDREGLPDSLRFWITRIEEADAAKTFSVGLIYGPSGCGKSSLVQAGLLPRLSKNVTAVCVEATPENTETRLLDGLRKRCREVQWDGFPNPSHERPTDLDLKQTLAALRRGQGIPAGKKVLIVLDQFEQWLHATKEAENQELVQALRQCDGGRVQCIVMVRDDFWLAVSRFMLVLEVDLVPGRNIALVDLFDLDHARKLLAAFGRAFGRLPENRGETSKEQKDFLKQAVNSLAEEGKVVCTRLALFAEMMKGKPWTPAALKEVGGTQGIGVTFLEETFSAQTANPKHHRHQKAVRAVLKALLPESDANIKGRMRSYAELLAASGYDDRTHDFDELMRILDNEVRLITPTEPEGEPSDEGRGARKEKLPDGSLSLTPRPSPLAPRFYQLTHDYLVPSLRDWLTRKQKETKRGRAELLLVDRAAVWNARPENRQLPSLWQCLSIRWLTTKKNWTGPQRKMLGRANRVHAVRGMALGLLLAVATVTGLAIREQVVEQRKAVHAAGLVRAVLNADTAQVPAIIEEISEYRKWADPLLRQENNKAAVNSRQKLHSSLALLPVDATQVDYLYGQLLDAKLHEVPVIRDALAAHQDALLGRLWAVVEKPDKGKEAQRLRAASALAKYDPESEKWTKASPPVVNDLVQENAVFLGQWTEAFRPVKNTFLAPLSVIFRDQRPERALATHLLADYAADDPRILAELLMDADEKQFAAIYPKFKEWGQQGLPVLTGEIDKTSPPELPSSDGRRERLAKRQANAAVALLRMNQPEKVWPFLKHSGDPRLRSYLIHRLSSMGADAKAIVTRLEGEPDLTIRRALILSLGEYGEQEFSRHDRQALLPKLQDVYRHDADPGLHAACEWLLRTWQQDEWLKQTNEEWAKDQEQRDKRLLAIQQLLQRDKDKSPPQWYVNSQGQTVVVFPGPVEFLMGSPPTEERRQDSEPQHKKRIGRTFALAAKSVTVEQYRQFEKGHQLPALYTRLPDLPVVAIDWYQAVRYCNWLSKEEKIPEEQWCYEIKGNEIKLKASYLSLSGYRLPTEAEMEYAIRAGAVTSRYFGETEDLLEEYAWYQKNSQERTWPVGSKKPNDIGLFDIQGNVWTWCQERSRNYPEIKGSAISEDKEDELVVGSPDARVLRGGSFNSSIATVRSAFRNREVTSIRDDNVGFRTARSFTP